MEESQISLLSCGIGIAVMAFLLWLGLRWNTKRSQALAQLASEMGYQFEVAEPRLVEKVLKSGFDLFRRGHTQWIHNLVHGPYRDSTMMVFDYRYVTGRGRQLRRRHWQTVALFSWGRLGLPQFTLRPRNWLDSLIAQVIKRGIDFEECPEFSRHYHLAGWSEVAIRQVFRSAVAELGERQSRLAVESSGLWLLVYRPKRLVSTGNMQSFIEEAQSLYDLLCAGSQELFGKSRLTQTLRPAHAVHGDSL